MSFKDVIEKMVINVGDCIVHVAVIVLQRTFTVHNNPATQAEDHGILFMPVPGQKRYEGKLLYSFGKATLFIDRGVVFVMKGAQWTPVSLDDLLRLAWC